MSDLRIILDQRKRAKERKEFMEKSIYFSDEKKEKEKKKPEFFWDEGFKWYK